ncbi:MAG: hypothetical protein U0795_12340 [Pirellulales bacterium]
MAGGRTQRSAWRAWRWLIWALAPALFVGRSTPVRAEETPQVAEPAARDDGTTAPDEAADGKAAAGKLRADQFVRIVRDDQQRPERLETSVIRFVGPHPQGGELQVDLVSAVHLGDKPYYEELNQRFAKYDAVLYELVAPEGTRIPRGGPGSSRHPLGAAQQGMGGALDLTFQLEEVDYTPAHFKHADLSPEEFAESMKQKDESVLKMVFKAMGHAMATQTSSTNGAADAKMLAAMLADNRPLEMKRVMAEQMANLELATSVFDSPGGSTLISVRNQRAIDVLAREVADGRRKVAIFYGGAHMPDMAAKLQQAWPLVAQQPEWLTAWNLAEPADQPK